MRVEPGSLFICCTTKRKSWKVRGMQRFTRILNNLSASMYPPPDGSVASMSTLTCLKHLRMRSLSCRSALDCDTTVVAARFSLTCVAGLTMMGERELNSRSTSAMPSVLPPSAMNSCFTSYRFLPTPAFSRQRRNSSKEIFTPSPSTMCAKDCSSCLVERPMTLETSSRRLPTTSCGGSVSLCFVIIVPVSAHVSSAEESIYPVSFGSSTWKIPRASRSVRGSARRVMSATNCRKLICCFILVKVLRFCCTTFCSFLRISVLGVSILVRADFCAGRNSEFMIHMANSSKSMVPERSESNTLKMRSTSSCGRMMPNFIKVKRNSLGVTCPDSPILFLRICVMSSMVVAHFSCIFLRMRERYESRSVLRWDPWTSLVRDIHTTLSATVLLLVFRTFGSAGEAAAIAHVQLFG
mmetsp:Transcript_8486/g.18630  ORF Transcript_8486/g.18630 Transcript_8486/m.18630 type:complete len:410 (-) Transcript_8486:126-1355(-)